VGRLERRTVPLDWDDPRRPRKPTLGSEDPTIDNSFRPSFPQRVARTLANDIVERSLRPGERLLEQALAERFGTSRAPIREALYLLDRQGLVERIPRKGAVVKTYTSREIEELYKVRVTLEELALERDCTGSRMVHLSLAALGPIVREMMKCRRKIERYHALHFAFHKTIIELSRSSALLRLYTQIEGPLSLFLRLSMKTKDDVSQSIEDHERILAAVGRADAAGASEILRAHEMDGLARALAALRNESSL
jgi:DNA-binding GntR family transcriptional regulator